MATSKHNTSAPHQRRRSPPLRPASNLTGKPFGRLIPQRYVGGSKWECLCECGNVTIVMTQNLTRGDTTSCGCFKREQFIVRVVKRTHGQTEDSIYNRWCAMIRRCHNPHDAAFADYGGRGITVCERWRHSFEAFYEDMGDPPAGMSLDRYPDNNGNYEPGNVRWATRHQQARNKRNAHLLTYNGETHGITTWAEKLTDSLHITKGCLDSRIRKGWGVERALTTPLIQSVRGANHPRAKLTEQQVHEIRECFRMAPKKYGLATQLARDFGVKPRTISSIITGNIWKHLAGESQCSM